MLVVMTREDIAGHHTVLCSSDTQLCCSTFSQIGAVATRSNNNNASDGPGQGLQIGQ